MSTWGLHGSGLVARGQNPPLAVQPCFSSDFRCLITIALQEAGLHLVDGGRKLQPLQEGTSP